MKNSADKWLTIGSGWPRLITTFSMVSSLSIELPGFTTSWTRAAFILSIGASVGSAYLRAASRTSETTSEYGVTIWKNMGPFGLAHGTLRCG
jgi:hypothetical protein